MRHVARLALLALGLAAIAQAAWAQDYPARTVTIVLPLGAGGAMDILLRNLTQRLEQKLGKSFVVENRGGGGTTIGATAVAKAQPDGYTLMFAPSGTLTTNGTVYKHLNYDPAKDFEPVALTSAVAFVLVINPELPIHSVTELIAYAKAHPGELSYGSPGIGTTPHLAMEMLKSMTGIQMTHVPYKGSMPVLNDIIAGHIQLTFTDPAISPALIEAGKLRALGVSSRTRLGVLPAVPPVAEAGLPGFEAAPWHMLLAPASTPKDIANKLNAEIKSIIALPEVEQQIIKMGLIPIDTPAPDELTRFLRSEITTWDKIVREVGLAGTE